MTTERNYATARTTTTARADIDAGLRSYMLSVYNYMASAMVVTGLVAYGTYLYAASNPAFAQAIYVSPLRWVIFFAPLAVVFLFAARAHKMPASSAAGLLYLFAALIGLSYSSILLVFSGQSVVRVFFITAAAFGGLSLYGYTTRKDLSGWGSFLIMGVIGIIVAMIANMFMQSSTLQMAISVVGVLVFAGLTAYDTQRLKSTYYALASNSSALASSAVQGALSLYLNFLNMFIFLLHLFGNSD